MGTIATVLQLLKLPDVTVKVLVEGNQRARIERFNDNPDFFQAYANAIRNDSGDVRELEALSRTVVSSEEHTSELQSLMRISSAVFCLTKTTIVHSHETGVMVAP